MRKYSECDKGFSAGNWAKDTGTSQHRKWLANREMVNFTNRKNAN